MELIYKTVESLEKPLEVDTTINPNWVYIRKDITTVTSSGTLKYVYQEACVTPEEYRQTDICAQYEQSMKSITKRQLLIWLYIHKAKTEEDIYTAIGTLPTEAQQYLGKVNYSGTNNFYYGNDFVKLIGLALGLTADEIKTMFDEAALL